MVAVFQLGIVAYRTLPLITQHIRIGLIFLHLQHRNKLILKHISLPIKLTQSHNRKNTRILNTKRSLKLINHTITLIRRKGSHIERLGCKLDRSLIDRVAVGSHSVYLDEQVFGERFEVELVFLHWVFAECAGFVLVKGLF